MARRRPPRKVTYFEPVRPRLAPSTIIESTFGVGRRFSCTMRVDCGQLDPGAVRHFLRRSARRLGRNGDIGLEPPSHDRRPQTLSVDEWVCLHCELAGRLTDGTTVP